MLEKGLGCFQHMNRAKMESENTTNGPRCHRHCYAIAGDGYSDSTDTDSADDNNNELLDVENDLEDTNTLRKIKEYPVEHDF